MHCNGISIKWWVSAFMKGLKKIESFQKHCLAGFGLMPQYLRWVDGLWRHPPTHSEVMVLELWNSVQKISVSEVVFIMYSPCERVMPAPQKGDWLWQEQFTHPPMHFITWIPTRQIIFQTSKKRLRIWSHLHCTGGVFCLKLKNKV